MDTQIRAKQAAVNRYHAGFENGTMDDATAGPRLRELHHQIAQLTARRDTLAAAIASQPQPPAPAVIGHLASYLRRVIDAGAPAERKAAIEALISQIRVTPEGLIPVFKIPQPGTPIPGQPGPTGSQATVRTKDSSVGDSGIEPLTSSV